MNSTPIQSPGCVILLIDESSALDAPVQEDSQQAAAQPKKKSESIATAINAMLRRLSETADFDVALVGYKTDGADQPLVGSRWGGSLEGQDFVSLADVGAAPVVVETRNRKVPNPAGFGPPVDEPIEFPVWYQPELDGKSPQVAAFTYCQELLNSWIEQAGPNPGMPVIIHIFAGGSGDGNPQRVLDEIKGLELPTGNPLIFQAHLSSSKTVPATKYPGNRYYLPVGPQKDLFLRCSPVPEHLVASLKEAKVSMVENAVGMIYNAKMLDIVTLLKLVDAHTVDWPSKSAAALVEEALPETIPLSDDSSEETPLSDGDATPLDLADDDSASALDSLDEPTDPDAEEATDGDSLPAIDIPAAPGEKAALLVLLLDRSVNDPYSGDMNNSCTRLQGHANTVLGRLAKDASGKIDTAVVSYGIDAAGEDEVRNSFEGPLAGETIVNDTALAEGALRIEETEEQVPNGLGGMMTIPKKNHIFVELEPTAASDPVPGFTAVVDILNQWTGQHPDACLPPVILHLTRAELDSDQLAEAASMLGAVVTSAGSVVLYHLAATETPHPSASYPADGDAIESDSLQAIFDATSGLLGRDQLAIDKPSIVNVESRGLVINGKFDLLFDGILSALAD